MFLLVAKGNKVYARQAERSRPGHARYAHPKNVGAGAYAWIWDFRANRTDEQGRFPPECGLVISRHSTTREGRANRWRRDERGSTAKRENGAGKWRQSAEFWKLHRVSYVFAQKYRNRAPVAFPKEASRRRVD